MATGYRLTRPDTDQVNFTSERTGEWLLEDYLQAAEMGNRTLASLLSDLFSTAGVSLAATVPQLTEAVNAAALQIALNQANAGYPANATLWSAGSSYAVGVTAYSPITQKVYRRLIAGTTATDPSLDGTNWAVVEGGMIVAVVTGTTQAAVNGYHYVLTNVATTTVTLPATPAVGDTVWITVANGLELNVIARNGKTIMKLAEDVLIDNANATLQLRYVNNDWKIV